MHDSIHYNRIGYNEAARNARIMLGEIEAPEVETSVTFLGWDGYTEVTEIGAATAGSSATLVVPKVYPVRESKNVTFTLSEGLTWNYYDLPVTSPEQTGVLQGQTASNAVSVTKAEPCSHFSDHLAQIPDEICCGLDLCNVTEHDEFFIYGTNWAVHSSGNVHSVTFAVEPGEQIYATSFGPAKTNGHGSSNGIRVTWFGIDGVIKTTDPEGAVGINIPMWNNSNEIYILNRDHSYENGTCAGCGDHKGAVIIQQPTSVQQELGKKFAISATPSRPKL